MSHRDFLDWLIEIGGGWLGYTEQQLDDTTIPFIIQAYEGKVKMLQACFGGANEETSNTFSDVSEFDRTFK